MARLVIASDLFPLSLNDFLKHEVPVYSDKRD